MPFAAVNALPTRDVPVIVGKTELDGTASATTPAAVEIDHFVVARVEFVAVTATEMKRPTSELVKT